MKITLGNQQMFPSRYASGDDLAGKAYTLIIESIALEKMTNPRTHQESEKYVIYFAKARRGFVLGKLFAESIAIALGTTNADRWIGAGIEIYPVTTRLGIGVRARPAPNGETAPPAAVQHDDDEEGG